MKHLQGRRNDDTARLRRIEAAVGQLLSLKIEQWNAVRLTVSAGALLAVRDAFRGKGDKGEHDQKPLREMVRARKAKDGS